jgi:hypothetical protein
VPRSDGSFVMGHQPLTDAFGFIEGARHITVQSLSCALSPTSRLLWVQMMVSRGRPAVAVPPPVPVLQGEARVVARWIPLRLMTITTSVAVVPQVAIP